MTAFRWIDRNGVPHDLSTAESIEDERRQIRQELLGLRPKLESVEDAAFMAAHAEAQVLAARLSSLQDDLRRFVRHEAARAVRMIEQIDVEASFLRDLHSTYQQRDERGSNAAALAAPPSAEQVAILRRQALRAGRQASTPGTFDEAYRALLADPSTCRTPLPATADPFEWVDRHMHFHQVRDLRQIELEYIELAGELARLLPQLAPEVPIQDIVGALEQIAPAVRRVSILERIMNCWSAHVIAFVRSEHINFLNALEKSLGHDV